MGSQTVSQRTTLGGASNRTWKLVRSYPFDPFGNRRGWRRPPQLAASSSSSSSLPSGSKSCDFGIGSALSKCFLKPLYVPRYFHQPTGRRDRLLQKRVTNLIGMLTPQTP